MIGESMSRPKEYYEKLHELLEKLEGVLKSHERRIKSLESNLAEAGV